MVKKLESIFTDDMEHCYFTGSAQVERHHVFGAFNKARSEKYKFIVPLHPTLHPNGVQANDDWKAMDLQLKQMCQRYYEEHYGSREDFTEEFGRNYLDEEDRTSASKTGCDDTEDWICDIGF